MTKLLAVYRPMFLGDIATVLEAEERGSHFYLQGKVWIERQKLKFYYA